MFGAVDADVLTNAWMSGRRIAGPNGVAKRVVSYAVPMVRIHLPPAERWYGAGGEGGGTIVAASN